MKISINGKKYEFGDTKPLKEIIEEFCKSNKRVIAELNGEIVKNPRWDEIIVQHGDSLELISFVGGG